MTFPPKSPSLSGFYFIGIGATVVGILVIAILNLATPLEFVIARIQAARQGGEFFWVHVLAYRFAILCLVAALACIPFLVILKQVLSPISQCLTLKDQPIPPVLEQKAKQRLINLPFIMVPVNILFWIFIPMCFFGGGFALNEIDSAAAITFSLRATMVGFISSAIVFFWMEAYARIRLIPFFFPEGRLSAVEGTIKIPILRRIRAFYRLGSLIPLANIILTLFILYLQVDSDTVSAETYGQGVLIFSIVVFILFFLGSGLLNRLVSRSIATPINDILKTMKKIKKGNYQARVKVVSNDEVGILGDATNTMIQGLAEKELLRDTFGRYVAPEVRDEIMEKRLHDLNKRFALEKRPHLSHGIGIHTGQVLAANIGSPDRLSYLLVGDAVNLASRLQSLTRELSARIIISADTAALLPENQVRNLLIKHPQPVRIKGRQTLVDIYLFP